MKFLLVVLSVSFWCSALAEDAKNPKLSDEERVFESRYISSEDGVRSLILTEFPALESRCYSFDGNQVVGVFEDPKNKSKPFLLIFPSASVISSEFTVNGEVVVPAVKANLMKFWLSNAGLDGDQGSDSNGEYQKYQIGSWISLGEISKFRLIVSLERPTCKYSIVISRSAQGEWKQEITKSEL